MKLTAFLGSPRAQGNTDILADRVLAGARDAGLRVEAVALRKLRIRPCTGCEKCWQGERACVLNDDMSVLYETIASSDILLFATPVYWYAPTAIMKAFIDRLVVFNRPQGRPLIEGKKAVIVVAYEEEGPKAAEPLVRMFEMSFDYLGVLLVGRVVADGVGPKGAVLEKPEVLEQAYEMGRRLG
ncbi:MAG TPA: flavodoxin family protein [Armatimonadota bacterium]|nr:flavodoxin family protein [Armatimonadota bacterium]